MLQILPHLFPPAPTNCPWVSKEREEGGGVREEARKTI